jgi:hypothetical protein
MVPSPLLAERMNKSDISAQCFMIVATILIRWI